MWTWLVAACIEPPPASDTGHLRDDVSGTPPSAEVPAGPAPSEVDDEPTRAFPLAVTMSARMRIEDGSVSSYVVDGTRYPPTVTWELASFRVGGEIVEGTCTLVFDMTDAPFDGRATLVANPVETWHPIAGWSLRSAPRTLACRGIDLALDDLEELLSIDLGFAFGTGFNSGWVSATNAIAHAYDIPMDAILADGLWVEAPDHAWGPMFYVGAGWGVSYACDGDGELLTEGGFPVPTPLLEGDALADAMLSFTAEGDLGLTLDYFLHER
jgi:hypothetical protein